MIYTYFILSLIMFFGLAQTVSANPWTLDRTISAALENSNSVAVEMLNSEEAAIDAYNASWDRYPTVSLSAGANVVSEVMEIDLPQKSIRFGDYDSYDMKIKVNHILYDGGRLKAMNDTGKKQALMSTYNAEAAKLAVEYQAKTAFISVVMSEESVKAANESVNEAKNHLDDVNALFGQGMALKNDVLRARLRISTAEMELVSRKADIERAKAQFRKVVGIKTEEEVIPEWNSSNNTYELPDYPEMSPDRPEYKAFDAAYEATDGTARSARAGLKPSVVMFGAFNYGRPGLDLPANEWMHYFSGGVLLNWNVWDWGKTRRNMEKVELNKRKILKNRNDFERTVSEQISEALAAYQEARKQHDLAVEAADLSQRNLELVSSSYREGMATETDYDNAHTAYAKAGYEKSVSEMRLFMSRARIEYSMGIRYKGENHE
ncbi:MAG: TolC family protein [Candidatus Latescibacteria bacterium]|nr:TolC family protein [Candidatus Latescibacterota bacterium]